MNDTTTSPPGPAPAPQDDPAASFAALALAPPLARALAVLGFVRMTPVQAHALPELLAGKDVIAQAVPCMAPHSTIGLVGLTPKLDDALPVPINQLIARGLRIVGIIEGDAEPDQFIPEMIEYYLQGRFAFDKLIAKYPLDQINQAIADQHVGKCVKPVMIPPC